MKQSNAIIRIVIYILCTTIVCSCADIPKVKEKINVEELESEIIKQTIPLVMEKIPIQMYGVEPFDGEILSDFDLRIKELQREFKLKRDSIQLEIELFDMLLVPTENQISRYRRTLVWDFFKFISSDTLKDKEVNVSSVNEIGEFSVVDKLPENVGTTEISSLGFIGTVFYSRILFNNEFSNARFIICFNGGSFQSKEFFVQATRKAKVWTIDSMKEL